MTKIVKIDDKLSSDNSEEILTSQEIDDEEYERYIPVEQSIIIALKQVREIQAGRLPRKTLDEFFSEIDEEIKAIEEEERANVNEKRRANTKIYG